MSNVETLPVAAPGSLTADELTAQQHERDQHQPTRDGHADHLVEAPPLVTAAVEPGKQAGHHGKQADHQHRADERQRPDLVARYVGGDPGGVAQPRHPHDGVVPGLGTRPGEASRAGDKPPTG